MRMRPPLLATLAAFPLLLACPSTPAGECEVDTDCAEGQACRALPDGERVCIVVVDDSDNDAGPEPAVAITTFTASPDVIDAGGMATLTWESENATSCAIDNGVGGVDESGSVTVSPVVSTTYTLSCQGTDGPALAEAEVQVRVSIPSFSADLTEANAGEEITFSWETVSAESCALAFGDASYAVPDGDLVSGTTALQATSSATATLTCEGAGGPAAREIPIEVASVVELTATPAALAAGQTTTVSWTVDNLTGCAVTGVADADPSDATVEVTLQESSTLSLACTGFRDVAVQRDLFVPVLILSFTADETTVAVGGSTTLRFTVDPLAASCDINGEAVDLGAGTHSTGAVDQTTTFTLTCATADGLVATSDPVEVAVP